MKPTDVDFLQAILNFATEGGGWALLMLAGVGIIIAFTIRIVRGSSFTEVVGTKNGYTKEKTFLAAIEDVKDLVREKADAEGKRMDSHSKQIDELRTAVQSLDRKVEKVSTKVEMMEQYRGK